MTAAAAVAAAAYARSRVVRERPQRGQGTAVPRVQRGTAGGSPGGRAEAPDTLAQGTGGRTLGRARDVGLERRGRPATVRVLHGGLGGRSGQAEAWRCGPASELGQAPGLLVRHGSGSLSRGCNSGLHPQVRCGPAVCTRGLGCCCDCAEAGCGEHGG